MVKANHLKILCPDLSSYIKSMLQADATMGRFIVDMNGGNIPDQATEKKLRDVLGPLVDGLSL